MNGFVYIFASLGLYIEIAYYNICLDAEKCEKQVQNMFSIAFLGTKSNT